MMFASGHISQKQLLLAFLALAASTTIQNVVSEPDGPVRRRRLQSVDVQRRLKPQNGAPKNRSSNLNQEIQDWWAKRIKARRHDGYEPHEYSNDGDCWMGLTMLGVPCTPKPSPEPTGVPTGSPTSAPSVKTSEPTRAPTSMPTMAPSQKPTSSPTGSLTSKPTDLVIPDVSGVEIKPTLTPGDTVDSDGDGLSNFFETLTGSDPFDANDPFKQTDEPTAHPTNNPTAKHTSSPSLQHSSSPSASSSASPSSTPTATHTSSPSLQHSSSPSASSSASPSSTPTATHTSSPSLQHSSSPSASSSASPSSTPTAKHTSSPSLQHSSSPSASSSASPSSTPTATHTSSPSLQHSSSPSASSSASPSSTPTAKHTSAPSLQHSSSPSASSSASPSSTPTATHTSSPSLQHSSSPSASSSASPSSTPTATHTSSPSLQHSSSPSASHSSSHSKLLSPLPTISSGTLSTKLSTAGPTSAQAGNTSEAPVTDKPTMLTSSSLASDSLTTTGSPISSPFTPSASPATGDQTLPPSASSASLAIIDEPTLTELAGPATDEPTLPPSASSASLAIIDEPTLTELAGPATDEPTLPPSASSASLAIIDEPTLTELAGPATDEPTLPPSASSASLAIIDEPTLPPSASPVTVPITTLTAPPSSGKSGNLSDDGNGIADPLPSPINLVLVPITPFGTKLESEEPIDPDEHARITSAFLHEYFAKELPRMGYPNYQGIALAADPVSQRQLKPRLRQLQSADLIVQEFIMSGIINFDGEPSPDPELLDNLISAAFAGETSKLAYLDALRSSSDPGLQSTATVVIIENDPSFNPQPSERMSPGSPDSADGESKSIRSYVIAGMAALSFVVIGSALFLYNRKMMTDSEEKDLVSLHSSEEAPDSVLLKGDLGCSDSVQSFDSVVQVPSDVEIKPEPISLVRDSKTMERALIRANRNRTVIEKANEKVERKSTTMPDDMSENKTISFAEIIAKSLSQADNEEASEEPDVEEGNPTGFTKEDTDGLKGLAINTNNVNDHDDLSKEDCSQQDITVQDGSFVSQALAIMGCSPKDSLANEGFTSQALTLYDRVGSSQEGQDCFSEDQEDIVSNELALVPMAPSDDGDYSYPEGPSTDNTITMPQAGKPIINLPPLPPAPPIITTSNKMSPKEIQIVSALTAGNPSTPFSLVTCSAQNGSTDEAMTLSNSVASSSNGQQQDLQMTLT